MSSKTQGSSATRPATTIPELEQSKAAVLNTLAPIHSRRSYAHAIDRFIFWYCSEPRLTFNRSVVMNYRSYLESRSLSAATVNLHLSAIRWLADESAESGWLTPELAIGIRRVKGVKRLGRKMGNWLTRNQAQDLVSAASKNNLRGWRDRAILGLLLGCGLRRSEVVGLNLDQLQSREGRWVIANLIGKGGRLRTVPIPSWCKELVDIWLRHSGVNEGRVFRRVLKGGIVEGTGVTANVVWYAVKRCAGDVGINNLAPHDLRRYAESEIMPNRDSNGLESARILLIVYRATRSMRHNPVCFTGHGRGLTLTINCLASFLVLWRPSSASPPSWRGKAGFGVNYECYGEVCLGESYRGQFGIPIFGGRQTMPNHSAEEQLRLLPQRGHSARSGIRHNGAHAECGMTAALAAACAMVVEANWSRFSFSLGTLLCKQRSGT